MTKSSNLNKTREMVDGIEKNEGGSGEESESESEEEEEDEEGGGEEGEG